MAATSVVGKNDVSGIKASVEAALAGWRSSTPEVDFQIMCKVWPGLLEQNLEADIIPRLAQMAFLVSAGALSAESCRRMLLEQPGSLGHYAVRVLWQQDGLVAVHKPFDMRIDLPKGEERRWPEELTVADWFAQQYPAEKVRFCHQLDHATSGVMLMASNKKAGSVGSQLFEKRLASKSYLALVLGHPPWEGEKQLTYRIADGEGFARHVPQPDEPGEEAETIASVLRRGHWPSAAEGCHSQPERQPVLASLLELRLITGRRHQIRVHLAAAGFPILGDDAYGGHPWGDRAGSYRMFLHSSRLVLPLAGSQKVVVEAPCGFLHELSVESPLDTGERDSGSETAQLRKKQGI
ncbi:unnamed protein product [Polarella glacialis]|uniref:Pseudouridine synthase RsuA/RluA-like domain-containing protein n=1 Tax=Polarella glacialis TaxID=89957 RepID=A0A813GA11_POLGL|nr:unnamed protein product [Polarella glacialis]CAE8733409.1 unnamed protein product [Polarella glacialis]